MGYTKPRTVPYRRKREQKTDYHKRLRLLLSRKARLVVRLTNQRVLGQVVHFDAAGDKVAASVDSFELKKLGWTYSCKNIPAAYLAGLLLAKKATAAGATEAIFDTGSQAPLHKGKLYAFLEGTIDGGLHVPHQPTVFPDEARIRGEHIRQYLSKAQKGFSQFAQYLKSDAQGEDIAKRFAAVKAKIK